jgi:hypothetical protein
MRATFALADAHAAEVVRQVALRVVAHRGHRGLPEIHLPDGVYRVGPGFRGHRPAHRQAEAPAGEPPFWAVTDEGFFEAS